MGRVGRVGRVGRGLRTAADGCGEKCKKVLGLRRDGFEPPTPCLKGACSAS